PGVPRAMPVGAPGGCPSVHRGCMPPLEPIEPTEITAGRLHLRQWWPSDAPAVFDACQDPEIARWTNVPHPYGHADAEQFVGESAPAQWASGTGAPFAVVDATSGGLLASVHLSRITPDGSAEIGFWCAPAARGQGVTAQAVTAVTRWAFGALGLARVG